jgi:hypothetical protein
MSFGWHGASEQSEPLKSGNTIVWRTLKQKVRPGDFHDFHIGLCGK